MERSYLIIIHTGSNAANRKLIVYIDILEKFRHLFVTIVISFHIYTPKKLLFLSELRCI